MYRIVFHAPAPSAVHYCPLHIAQIATVAASAALSDSARPAIGMTMGFVQAAMISSVSPLPSLPMTTALGCWKLSSVLGTLSRCSAAAYTCTP